MKINSLNICLAAMMALFLASSCLKLDDTVSGSADSSSKKLSFDVSVTREGQPIPSAAVTRGSSAESSDNRVSTMDKDRPFGLVAIDRESETLILDNQPIFSDSDGYSALFDLSLWEVPAPLLFSAYYPYVESVGYADDLSTYSIHYTTEETEAGPTVSKTIERAITQLNMLPLVFQHITNDIGYMISDVTPDPQLQGLIHLRRVTAYNVASAGVFVNDIENSRGTWKRQAYFRDVTVFEGDAIVGVGLENEKFVGAHDLVDSFSESNRYYAIPDEIKIGKQYVEVEYDVEGFSIDGFPYSPLKGQTAKYMLYGLLPDNVFVYGRQYTFHLGLDLTKVYKAISFSASVSDWETKIYENNDVF